MRRPARTRRLSIAAILSLLAFVVLMGEGARSLWSWEQVAVGNGMALGVDAGSFFFAYDNQGMVILPDQNRQFSPQLPHHRRGVPHSGQRFGDARMS